MTDTDGSGNPTNTNGPDNLRTAYDQLCTSYHAIDDFRAKLLGFLPLVTGGGLILLTGRAGEVGREFFRPVGSSASSSRLGCWSTSSTVLGSAKH